MLHLAAAQASVQPAATTEIARGHVEHTLSAREVQQLAVLRERAVMVRVAPRVEPFHCCALIEANPHCEVTAYGDAILHVLPQALGRSVLFRRLGGQRPSFDEGWALNLLAVCGRGDEASVRFALGSRCAHAFQRPLAFLFKGLASRLEDRDGALSSFEDASQRSQASIRASTTER